ncbi:autotransporter outer membrane beta-barrel domain-containing protein [Stenotrophomonas sp. S48]|nr:autotransporter outer membrane beta-barrel domain-containing protein [Stenotrophomonas sp. S48]MBK0047153.1 autotransporter outer membrane beta-barrel domain-containing protein [Stenotrophomonas sp. S49]
MKDAVRRSLALAVASSLAFAAAPVHARTLTPGQSATVQPGDTAETWSLSGATLTVNPGGQTLRIAAGSSSNLLLLGAGVSADVASGAVALNNSTSEINDTNIRNTGGRALTLADVGGGGLPGSVATVRRSDLLGLGVGASVATAVSSQRAILIVDATRIEALANNGASATLAGNGLLVIGTADVSVQNGSSVIGAQNGIYAIDTDVGGASNISIDGSLIEGQTGAAVRVAPSRSLTSPRSNVVFNVRNNGQLVGGDGNLLFVEAPDATVGFNVDDSRLTGNIINTVGSTVDVSLTNNATLLGVIQGITSMSLDNARWQMSGDSSTGSLSLGSGGEIALGDGAAFHTLNVSGNFTGADGTLIFNTVLAGDDAASDKLVIGGDTSGTANVRVDNVGGAGAQTVNGIELISVAGASNGQFNLAGRAVGGQYEYFLHKGTGTDGNWYLRSVLPTAPDPCEVDPSLPECNPSLPGPDPDPVLRPEPGAYLANLQAAQTMFRLGYHDRHAGQNAGRAWARVDGSRNGFDAVSQQLDIRGNSQALTVGADLWRADTGSSVGVMLSTGNASSTSTNELTGYYARSKVKGEALGLYGTWRGGNGADPYAGFYLDGSVRRAQFRNRVEGIGLAGERYDSRAWQGAVEGGYAFRVGGASNGGIYLEPQLQVGYSRWDDYRHTETNGTVVVTENADGLFGRAGLRLSGVTRWGNGAAEVQPYLAANWLHTRAESQISMDDEVVDARIPRSRGEFSAGASVKFGSGVGIWGGLSLQRASGYHQNAAQGGVSYSW